MAVSKQQLQIHLKASGIKVTKAQLKSLHRQVNATKAGMAGMAGAMAMASVGFYAAARAIGSVISTGKEFQQAMANVKAISGATGAEFKALEDNAKKLGATTVHTASDVAALQTEFAKLGFTASEITQVTASTLALSTAVGADLATSAATAGTTLRGFGLDVSETSRVTDVMALSFSSSALDMAKFTDSMKYVAPIAKAAGMDLEGTTAILGRLANAGISGSMAGTSLRKILLEAGNAGSKLAKRMGGPISSFEDFTAKIAQLKADGLDPLSEGADLVGKRAVTAFSILLEGVDSTNALGEALNEAGGAAQDMADIQLDTLEGSLKLATSAMDGLKIEMFEMNEGALRDLVDGFTKFIESIDPEDLQAYGVAFKTAGIAVSAYGAHVLLATILTRGLAASIASTPIGLLIVGATILGAELIKLSGNFGTVTDEAVDQSVALERAKTAFKNFKSEIATFGIKELNSELEWQQQMLNEYTQNLNDGELALAGLGSTYEEYVRLKNEDTGNSENLLSEYDSYVSLTEYLRGTVLTLEDWVEQNNISNGVMTDGIATMEDWEQHQADIAHGYRMDIEASQEMVDQTQEEIDAMQKRKDFIESENAIELKRQAAEELAVIEQSRMDEADEMIETFNENWANRAIHKDELERARLIAAAEDSTMLESNKLLAIENVNKKFDKLKDKRDADELKSAIAQGTALANAAAGFMSQFKGGAKIAARIQQAAAVVNMLSGATAALAPPPVGAGPIWGPVLAATVVATGLTNIAQISKSIGEFESMAQGGLITGPGHSGGGVNINAEGGEFVMKRDAVDAIGVETMNAINEGDGGGSVNISFEGNVMSEDFIIDEAIPIIEEAIRRGSSIGIG